jgi:hypothetical protein
MYIHRLSPFGICKSAPNAAFTVHVLVLEDAFVSAPRVPHTMLATPTSTYEVTCSCAVTETNALPQRGIYPYTALLRAMVLVREWDEVFPPVVGRVIFGALRVSGAGTCSVGCRFWNAAQTRTLVFAPLTPV